MLNFMRRGGTKAGLPPGTPVYVGEKPAEKVRVTVIDYDKDGVRERQVDDAEQCRVFADSQTVTWINVDGVHDVGLIEKLGEMFRLHPLILEDIAHTAQRPKAEEYEGCIYVVVRMLSYQSKDDSLDSEQVSFLFGKGFVMTFQEREGDVFDVVRDRIRQGAGRVRKLGADYLLYSLLDAVVDSYFAICETLSERVEPLHDELLNDPDQQTLHRVQKMRGEVVHLRRAVWPLREVISNLERTESSLLTKPVKPFMRDAYDHTIHIAETVDMYRDLIGGMVELYLSSVSNRMNEVMKVLTIIATIFIPLSFVAGLYGMNFDNMPELHWRFGYPVALAVMAAAAGGMLLYFRRHKWI